MLTATDKEADSMRLDARRDSFDELDRAIELAEPIKRAQGDIESGGEIPHDLITSIKEAGLFRLLLDRSLGGASRSLTQFIRVVETIAEADGSAGWCVGQGGVYPNIALYLSDCLAQSIWVEKPSAVVATGTPNDCRAVKHDDHYTLSGRWRFASGIMHADWLAAMSPAEADDGSPLPYGMFLFRRDEADVRDGWNVRGMRGTGSREYRLENQKIPLDHAIRVTDFSSRDGPSTGLPNHLLFATAFGSVGIGIARRALDEFAGLALGKTPTFTNKKLLDDDLVHVGLGQAEARWGATRAFLLDVGEACEHVFDQRGEVDESLKQRLRLAATHAMRQSAKVVDQVYELSGSDVIFDDHPIHRCFQDIHTLTQQIQGRPSHYRAVGRSILDLDPDPAMNSRR